MGSSILSRIEEGQLEHFNFFRKKNHSK